MSYVYIAPLENGVAFKVGKANDPVQRLNQLSKTHKFDTRRITCINCGEESYAFELESSLHKILKPYNAVLFGDGGTESGNSTESRSSRYGWHCI